MHDNINRQQHISTPCDTAQALGVSERFYNLFVGNERRHLKSYGPPLKAKNKRGEDKWKLKVATVDEPATLALWQDHFDSKFILSIIPRLDDGTCWFACIDADEYDLDYIEICERIRDLKLPLLPVVSKSCGLHLFAFFKEPAAAKLVIPALKYMAMQLRLKDYEIFPSSAEVDGDGNTRGVSMPYGARWELLPEQCFLAGHGNSQLQADFLNAAERMRIGKDELPQAPKSNGEDHAARKIPLALQAAIDSLGPYPNGDRSPVCASIIWHLAERGFTADEVQVAVENRGPFVRYNENNRSLKGEIKKILERYVTAHPDKAEVATPLPIQSTTEFVSNFTPPDYLADGLIQRRFIYSMTGATGDGKTSVALLIALHVDQGRSLDGHEIDKGKVLYCAGENPDDVRMRWIKQLADAEIDPASVNVHFIPGSFAISDKVMREQMLQANREKGPFDLLVFDTSAAFFAGDDDNVNMQMLAHAKGFRSLVPLIGNPAVIVPSHPVKNFSRDNMVPRGGGAFLNEMDGNFTCMKVEGTMMTELHWCGKIRGVDFNAIPFRLEVGQTEKLKDSKGRGIWTVTARPVTDMERDAAENTAATNQNKLLAAMIELPGASLADLAAECGWTTQDGKPYKSLVQRLVNALKIGKLAKKETGRWVLTKAGIAKAKEYRDATD